MSLKCFYRPLKPFAVNQPFGANRVCISTNGNKTIIGCDGNNPPAGYKSLYGPRGHLGIDLQAYHGQEVYAAQAGRIYEIDTSKRSGLDVRIESTVGGRKFRHIYEHLLGYQGKVGDIVLAGQLIGWADNTGYSSGDHVHFEVQEFINGKWVPIDPWPLMYTIFARDVLPTPKKMIEIAALLLDWTADAMRQQSRGRS